MNLLIWAGEVALYWLFLYGILYLFLRNLTLFRWNRAYLLGSMVVSLFLPLVEIPEWSRGTIAVYTSVLPTANISNTIKNPEESHWMLLLLAVYLTGVVWGTIRFSRKLLKLSSLWKKSILLERLGDGISVYLLPEGINKSFSFLGRVGISQRDYAAHYKTIVAHELIHVRQYHTYDILFTELLRTAFWFNPTLLLYRKSLQEQHEFLVDREIQHRDDYAKFLIGYSFNFPEIPLVNNFFKSSLLKQRIEMLYRTKTTPAKTAIYVFSAALTLILTMAIAACNDQFSQKDEAFKQKVVESTSGNDKIFTVAEELPQFPGGLPALYKFLADNIRYPEAAAKSNISGRVFVQFQITSDGSIKDVMVLKGIGFGCDAEAVRTVKAMPKWIPARQGGKPVNMIYNLPINFQI